MLKALLYGVLGALAGFVIWSFNSTISLLWCEVGCGVTGFLLGALSSLLKNERTSDAITCAPDPQDCVYCRTVILDCCSPQLLAETGMQRCKYCGRDLRNNSA